VAKPHREDAKHRRLFVAYEPLPAGLGSASIDLGDNSPMVCVTRKSPMTAILGRESVLDLSKTPVHRFDAEGCQVELAAGLVFPIVLLGMARIAQDGQEFLV